jgi:hypothetical protein
MSKSLRKIFDWYLYVYLWKYGRGESKLQPFFNFLSFSLSCLTFSSVISLLLSALSFLSRFFRLADYAFRFRITSDAVIPLDVTSWTWNGGPSQGLSLRRSTHYRSAHTSTPQLAAPVSVRSNTVHTTDRTSQFGCRVLYFASKKPVEITTKIISDNSIINEFVAKDLRRKTFLCMCDVLY